MKEPKPPAAQVPSTARNGNISEKASEDVRELLQTATTADGEIDWERIRESCGLTEPPQIVNRYRDHETETIEGVEIVKGVNEGEVLATFWDQDDAREMIENDIPREYQQYWCRGTDVTISLINNNARVYQKQQTRLADLLNEEQAADDKIKSENTNRERSQQYQSILKAYGRFNRKVTDMERLLVSREQELWELHQRPVDYERRYSEKAALKNKIQRSISEARDYEQLESIRIDNEAQCATINLSELTARTTIEHVADDQLLSLRLSSINDTELVRFQEEEIDVRTQLSSDMLSDLIVTFTPIHHRCKSRCDAQERIAELKRELGQVE